MDVAGREAHEAPLHSLGAYRSGSQLCPRRATGRAVEASYRAEVFAVAKVLAIPSRPSSDHLQRERTTDARYVEGQRLLVGAMTYLLRSDPKANRLAVEFLSEHVRTKFRMSNLPLQNAEE